MEGMGLKLTPVVVRRLLSRLDMFGPMSGTSWIIASPNGPNRGYIPSPASHPPPPPASPPPACPSPIMCHQ